MKALGYIAVLILCLVAMGYVGNSDRANEIVSSLPSELVAHIRAEGFSSNKEIAKEYMCNKAKYDQLAERNLW